MPTTHASPLPATLAGTLPTGLLIDGEWRKATGGGTFAVHDPASGDTLVEVADGRP